MRLGQFMERTAATKDMLRHYESLGLLQPIVENTRRIYSEREVADFAAIKEMQSLGLSLKEIQAIFTAKRTSGCGSPKLLEETIQTLKLKRQDLDREAAVIRRKQETVTAILQGLEKIVQHVTE